MEPTLEPLSSGLAAISDQTRSAAAVRICLVSMGGELFAIDLRHVREVFELESITPVPGMPASLVGVANLRGTVVPLADLRPRLGMPATVSPKYAVVVQQGPRQVGILIDEVPEIRTIYTNDVLTTSAQGVTESRPFLSGLIQVDGRMSGMVEVSRLLVSVEGSDQ